VVRIRIGKTFGPVGPVGNMIFGLVFAAVGVLVAVIGLSTLAEANASASWPTIKGAVVSSDVEKKTSTRSRKKKRESSTSYRAVVRYEYTVGDKQHTSGRISFGGTSTSMGAAKELVGRYPKGAEVDVYYDPDDPEQAVLESGKQASSYIPLGVGVLFTIVGSVIAIFALVGKIRLEANGVEKASRRRWLDT